MPARTSAVTLVNASQKLRQSSATPHRSEPAILQCDCLLSKSDRSVPGEEVEEGGVVAGGDE